MRSVFRTCVRVAAGFGVGTLTVVVAIGIYIGVNRFNGNFAIVVAGEVYRSAQPDGLSLSEYTRQYGIRSVINLRGENSGSRWYDEEITTARALGLAHYDMALSASRQLDQAQAEALIEMMMEAPKPLLIHCKAGADRSGLASALYVAAVARLGEEKAEEQISIRFDHISLPISAAYAMDVTFEKLEPWLGFPDS